MNKNFEVIVIGRDLKRFPVEQLSAYEVLELKDFYQLKAKLINSSNTPVYVIQFCAFLDDRHLNGMKFLMKEHESLRPIFVTKEISEPMKNRLRNEKDWQVYWTTDHFDLNKMHLEMEQYTLREHSRKDSKKDVLLGPSDITRDNVEAAFKPFMGSVSQNLSAGGICLAVMPQAPFKEKDFVSVNFKREDGEYATYEGQVRWVGKSKKKHQKLVGIQYVSKK